MKEGCKICGGEIKQFHDPHLKRDENYIDYNYCETCQFICKDDRALVSLEEEKAEYELHENSTEDERYLNMFREFLRQSVIPFASSGRKALDFGSGPEPVLAKVLAEEYGYITDIYDLFYAPTKVYEGKKYDLITCTEVVEHLKEPLEYFKLFEQLLNEDGIVAIMTHFHPQDREQFGNWYYRRELTHISFFTVKTMGEIAQKVNLKLIYTDNKKYSTFQSVTGGLRCLK